MVRSSSKGSLSKELSTCSDTKSKLTLPSLIRYVRQFYSFIHSFVHSFIHSFIHLFIHSSIQLFIDLFNYSFIHSIFHSFFIHVFIFLFFIHSHIHPFINPFIHSLILLFTVSADRRGTGSDQLGRTRGHGQESNAQERGTKAVLSIQASIVGHPLF